MKRSRKIVQLSLISIGLFLILVTYFLYPKIIENKFIKEKTTKDKIVKTEGDNINMFENVEYKGVYNIDKPIVVTAEKALVLKEKPEIIFMTNMRVTLHLDDQKIIIITSDKGSYNKITYDCFFEQNVKVTDGETKIFAENLDLVATTSSVKIYKDVTLNYTTGSLVADKINYNFETKYFKVSMFDDKTVKIKVTK